MKIVWTFLIASLIALVAGVLFWLGQAPPGRSDGSSTSATAAVTSQAAPALRIGLVPERDIFAMNKRYKALAAHMSSRLGRGVDMVMVNTYQAVLQDFSEKKIDAALLGSLVAVLAMDRMDAEVLVKPEYASGVSSYRGVVFVREDSPIKGASDLAGRSIAMVRTTMAGHLFPSCLLLENGLLDGPRAARMVWVGTHDDVATEVMAGRVDAGAIKDLRLEDALRSHGEWKVRRLATSEGVPENALVVRADLSDDLKRSLADLLLGMDRDDAGRRMLAELGFARFVPCRRGEYGAVYDMIERLGGAWGQIGVDGPAPRRQVEGRRTKVEGRFSL